MDQEIVPGLVRMPCETPANLEEKEGESSAKTGFKKVHKDRITG